MEPDNGFPDNLLIRFHSVHRNLSTTADAGEEGSVVGRGAEGWEAEEGMGEGAAVILEGEPTEGVRQDDDRRTEMADRVVGSRVREVGRGGVMREVDGGVEVVADSGKVMGSRQNFEEKSESAVDKA